MKFASLVAWLVLLIVFISGGVVYAKGSAEQSCSKGVDYVAQGEFVRADKAFKDALRLDKTLTQAEAGRRVLKDVKEGNVKKDAAALIIKGDDYYKSKSMDMAVQSYSKAIGLDPGYAPAYYKRGKAYYVRRMNGLAIADYSKVLELDPDHYCACKNRARLYFDDEQYDKAIADYTRAIEIKPDNTASYNNRAAAYVANGQDSLAIRDYAKSIELDSYQAAPHLGMGYIYTKQGRYEQAIKDLDKTIKFAPANARGYKMRGYVYIQLSRHEQAVVDLTRAIKLDPDDATSYYNRSGAFRALGQEKRSSEDYRKTFELDPDYIEARPSFFSTAVVRMFIYFIVAVFLGTFILHFVLGRNFGRTPSFVPGTNISLRPSIAAVTGVVVVAYLFTHGVIELLRYIVFPAIGITLLGGRLGGVFVPVLIGFFTNAIVYSRLVKYPESGPVGFKYGCYLSLIVYMIWLGLFILFMLVFYAAKAIFGFVW